MKGFESENYHKGRKIDLMSHVEWIPTYKLWAGGIKLLLFFVIWLFLSLLSLSYCIYKDIDGDVGVALICIYTIICLSSTIYYVTKKTKKLRMCYDEMEKSKSRVKYVSKNGCYGLLDRNLNKELLEACYDAIVREKNFYTIYQSGLCGVYNSEIKRIIIPCMYDRIEFDKFLSNIKAYKGGECHLFTATGVRKQTI